MAKIVSLKIGYAAPNELADSTDNAIYGLTNLPTPVTLLTVDAALKMASSAAVCL